MLALNQLLQDHERNSSTYRLSSSAIVLPPKSNSLAAGISLCLWTLDTVPKLTNNARSNEARLHTSASSIELFTLLGVILGVSVLQPRYPPHDSGEEEADANYDSIAGALW